MNRVIAVIGTFVILTGYCYAEESFLDKHEVGAGYSFFTKHFSDEEYNECNHGVAAFFDNWFAITCNNSNNIRSWMFGYTFRTRKWHPRDTPFFGRLNLHVGPLYGYQETAPSVEGWTIGAMPTFEVGYSHIAIETMVAPTGGGVIACMFKLTF